MSVKGTSLRELVEAIPPPLDEARSNAMFEKMMAKIDEEDRERQRVRSVGRALGGLCATFVAAGTGAFRLFTPFSKPMERLSSPESQQPREATVSDKRTRPSAPTPLSKHIRRA